MARCQEHGPEDGSAARAGTALESGATRKTGPGEVCHEKTRLGEAGHQERANNSGRFLSARGGVLVFDERVGELVLVLDG